MNENIAVSAFEPEDGGAVTAERVRCLLHRISEGDRGGAADQFRLLRPLIRRTSIEKILYSLAGGGTPVRHVNNLFFLNTGDTDIGSYENMINSTADTLSRFFGAQRPTILVEIDLMQGGRSYSIGTVPGFGFIHLAIEGLPEHTGFSGESKPGTVAHELGHCFMNSGNRFLDEGVATYSEYIAQGLPVERIFADLGTDSPAVDLETVCSLDLSRTHILEDVSPDNPRAIYLKAAAAVALIIDEQGVDCLKELFDHPEIDRPGTAGALIEATTGKSLAELEAALNIACGTLAEDDPDTNIDPTLLEAVGHSYLRMDWESCRDAIPVLERYLAARPENPLVLEALIKAKASHYLHCNYTKSIAPQTSSIRCAELTGRINRYVALNPGTPEASFFTVLRDILELSFASLEGSEIKIKMALDKSRRSLDRAYKSHPDDAVVVLSKAKFIGDMPEQYGGGRQAARQFLLQCHVPQSHRYHPDIEYWIAQYHQTPAEPADESIDRIGIDEGD